VKKCCEYKDKLKKYRKEYYKNNRDKVKEQSKEYYKNHKDKAKEYNKEYRGNNEDKLKEYNKEYRKNNEDKLKEYYEDNKGKIIERGKNYREKNKDRLKEQKKEYYEDNKDKIKEGRSNDIPRYLYKNAKYRAKYKKIQFDITIEDVINVMPKDNICSLLNIKMKYNNGKVNYNSFTLDRIDPTKGYTPHNIQVISSKANTSKNDSTLNEYELIVNNLEKYTNNRDLIIENGGNYNVKLKTNLDHLRERTKKYKLPKSDIDLEYLHSIYPKDNKCILLNVQMIKGKGFATPSSPTLDRIIPELGYVKGNVMFISHRANIIKYNLTLNEMKLLLSNWKKQMKL